jgi:hypothetical protein
MCTIPIQKFHVTNNTNFNLLLNYVNAAAYGNTWVMFEHLNTLNLELLSLLNKEIQLVQQKVILADLHRSPEINTIVKLNPPEQEPEKQAKRRVAYGLFCSVFTTPFDKEELSKQESILHSSYRVTSLLLPDFEFVVKNLLYVNGFTSFLILADKVNKFRELVEKKIEEQESVFLTEDAPKLRAFNFKLSELMLIVEMAVDRRELVRQDYGPILAELELKKKLEGHESAKEEQVNSQQTTGRKSLAATPKTGGVERPG